jgi:hypothetical protein
MRTLTVPEVALTDEVLRGYPLDGAASCSPWQKNHLGLFNRIDKFVLKLRCRIDIKR